MQTQTPPVASQPTVRPRPRSAPEWWRTHSWLHPEEGWLPAIFLFLVVSATIWTVEGARWVADMPPLLPVAVVAMGLGFLLAKLRLPSVLLHPVAVVVGGIAIIWATASACTGATSGERLNDLVVRLYRWWEVVGSGGISSDPIPFIFQVVALDWIVSYLSAWFVFRSQRLWLGVVPSGVALLVNLTYLPGRFTSYFVLYVIASMLLVSRLHLVHQQRRWRAQGVEAPATVGVSYLAQALVVGVLALSLAWQVPVANAADSVSGFWERVSGPWRDFEREFDRLFASVSSGRAVPLHSFGKTLPFRGAVTFGANFGFQGTPNFGQSEVMYVQAPQAGYWRAAAYDTYTGQGWTSSARITAPAPRESRRAPEDNLARRDVVITVEVQAATDVIFSQGIPLSTEATAISELPAPASYTVFLIEQGRNRGLPGDLQRSAEQVRDRLRGADRLYTRDEIQRMLPPDIVVDSVTPRRVEIESINVTRLEPTPPDAAAIRSKDRMPKGFKYQVTSSVSDAGEEDLREAGTDYPGWVQDRYLQLPRDLPQRVRDLAREWTDAFDNPYDKAAAIERRLRTDYTYSLQITAPPQGVDGVDHFLFTARQGYCDYYASAMAVLLRSLGIPARVAVGYVSGDFDNDKQAYVVREPHAHSWPEVYFPRYGWIEFNPTSAWPSLPRSFSGSGSDGENPEDFDSLLLDDPEMDALEESLGSGSSGLASEAAGTDWAVVLRPYIFLLAALALAGVGARTAWMWGLSRLNVAAQTYEKVSRLGILAGLPRRPQDTPWEYAERVGTAVPNVRDGVFDITQAYTRYVFSKREPEGEEVQRITSAWRAVRRALLLKALHWKGRRQR